MTQNFFFWDQDHLEAFSNLLGEEEVGGDGGIPALDEEDEIEDVTLKFTYEDLTDEILEGPNFTTSKNDEFIWAPEKSSVRSDIPERTWELPLNCFMHVSGIDEEYAKRNISEMNEYVKKNKTKAGRFAGSQFTHFGTDEYCVFLGILLTISLDGRKAGSYQQYWIQTSTTVCVGSEPEMTINLDYHSMWAKEFMELNRFKQFLSAFRAIVETPKDVKDKAAHIRPPVVAINKGAKRTFILGRNVLIDEAGVASRSRYNPIQQYKKDRPNKFQVDFFFDKLRNKLLHLLS